MRLDLAFIVDPFFGSAELYGESAVHGEKCRTMPFARHRKVAVRGW
jgi:hypothetical protein